MKINLNIKQKIYLSSGLIVVIVAILIGFVIRPLLVEIKTTSSSVKESRGKLFVLQEADQAYLERLELDCREVKDDISLVSSRFLDMDQVVDFIVGLEKFASATSNKLEIKRAEYPEFTLYLSGSFSNLMKYIGWIENSDYFANIQLLQIRRVDEQRFLSGEESALIGSVRSTIEVKAIIKDFNNG